MSEKIPNVPVLKAITPSHESSRSGVLTYDNLEPAVKKNEPYLTERSNRTWDSEDGSLEELSAARQLAMQYMLKTSLALAGATSPESRELWSDRYTQATSELYGIPDDDVARALERGVEIEALFPRTHEVLREFLESKYEAVLKVLEVDDAQAELSPEQVALYFEKGLKVLAEQFDPEWSDWHVERVSEKDSLSTVPGEKKVIVGMVRANMKPDQLKPLFAHEVLVHAQRGLNGSKVSHELQVGLPDYLDAEEGLGVFVEYALSGRLSHKTVDRYTDIAYALGKLDGKKHTREELIERAKKRAFERNEQSDNKESEEDIIKAVYAHVNRIYRGSLGNEHIGVFTKDIAYFKGFLEIGRYIEGELEAGSNIDGIMQFLLQGKFDPTNKSHLEYLQEHLSN